MEEVVVGGGFGGGGGEGGGVDGEERGRGSRGRVWLNAVFHVILWGRRCFPNVWM